MTKVKDKNLIRKYLVEIIKERQKRSRKKMIFKKTGGVGEGLDTNANGKGTNLAGIVQGYINAARPCANPSKSVQSQ